MIAINNTYPDHLKSDYKSFNCDKFNIDGLVKITNSKASFLAIFSNQQKQGNATAFINWLKTEYNYIEFREVMDRSFARLLLGNGFYVNHVETAYNLNWHTNTKNTNS